MRRLFLLLLLAFSVSAHASTAYFMSATGSDSADGLTTGTAWLTPNHSGLNCGDTISAAAGNYNAMIITAQPTCAVHDAVWVKCAVFDTCKINSTGPSSQGIIDIQASNWAFTGWELSDPSAFGTNSVASCFAIIPASASIHDVYLINDIANGCMAGGYNADNNGALSIDYIVYGANIAYNAAQSSAFCYSGYNVLQPQPYDTQPGTHIYMAQLFGWNNVEPPTCAGTPPTDGEGIILDTFNGIYQGFTPYDQQAVITDALMIYNGSAGIGELGSGNKSSHIIIKNSTAAKNFISTTLNTSLCGQIESIGFAPTNPDNINRLTDVSSNLAATDGATAPGCGTNPAYAYMFGNVDNTTNFSGNAGFSNVSQNVGKVGTVYGFAPGPNVFGVNPAFANTVMPAAPNCSGKTDVIDCMSTVIADFTPTNTNLATYGYHAPQGGSVVDPLFPQFLCNNANMPTGLMTMGCTVALASISIHPPSTGFYVPGIGDTIQPTVTCTYTSGPPDNCASQSLTWGSTEPTIISVNSSTGLVTNVSTILDSPFAEVFVYTGKIFDHHNVTFTTLDATTITWYPTNTNQIVTGTTVLPSPGIGGNVVSGACNFGTSDASIATVNLIGEVTGVAPGSVNVTCTIGANTSTHALSVVTPTQTLSTWYAGRPGGGPRDNTRDPSATIFCDGTVDVDAPTSGSGTFHCAFDNPMWLATDNTGSSPQSSYTGVVQSGDTAIIHDIGPQPPGTPSAWPINCNPSGQGCWNTSMLFGQWYVPSGTPAHPTRILGANYASCTQNYQRDIPHPVDNRTHLFAQLTSQVFGTIVDGGNPDMGQNIQIGCLDIGTYIDCQNVGFVGNQSFACPVNTIAPWILNDFSANITVTDTYVHGWYTSITGRSGPGTVLTDFRAEDETLSGTDFDDPFNNNPAGQSDGFTGSYFDAIAGGSTEEQDKVLSSLSRDGSGVLTLNFTNQANSGVDWFDGDNVVIDKAAPSDLNGTYPVTSITFNQQSVAITGGSCTPADNGGSLVTCTFTTSTTPAFGQGAFVQITGTTISGGSGTSVNGFFEVFSSSSGGFVVNASPRSRIGWDLGTIGSGGTAGVATSLTVQGTGGAETATTAGVAHHVWRQHRSMDQDAGGAANGDGFSAGNVTLGPITCDHCLTHHNAQDGFDGLHGGLTIASYTNSISYANIGGAVKNGNADTVIFTNDLMVANCAVMLAHDPNRTAAFNQYLHQICRANGALAIQVRPWSQVNFGSNSILSGQQSIFNLNCGDGIGCNALPTVGTFQSQNSTYVGYTDTNNPSYSGSTPGVYTVNAGIGPTWTWACNNSFNVHGEPWSDACAQSGVDPKIVQSIPNIASFADEVNAISFDMNLTSSSPLIGAGVHNSFTPTLDLNGTPNTNPPAVSAYGLMNAPPPLNPPLQLSGHIVFSGSIHLN